MTKPYTDENGTFIGDGVALPFKLTVTVKIIQECGQYTKVKVEDHPEIELDDKGKDIILDLENYLIEKIRERT